MQQKKGIAILGSTGSIGRQTLEVYESNQELFNLDTITANGNAELLIKQALKYKPNNVVIADESKYSEVKNALANEFIHVYAGESSLEQVVQSSEIDIVLTALVGFAGLKPTLSAIRARKHIALANKETLVVAGNLVTQEAKASGVSIFPVDSEHSAIFQCLAGEFHNPIEKIYLTASGGPFRGFSKEALQHVTLDQALKHPNWSMGSKITIDSATLMNKGLEVIEAKWLFGLKPEQIDVIVHPQSIIHSMVQFEDGSMKAQMGLPDMKLPIQYALSYPERIKSNFPRFNFADYPSLSFEKADRKTFRNLDLAYEAMHQDGSMPCALNAANEITVEAFLKGKISFLQIAEINELCMLKSSFISNPDLTDYFEIDRETRRIAADFCR